MNIALIPDPPPRDRVKCQRETIHQAQAGLVFCLSAIMAGPDGTTKEFTVPVLLILVRYVGVSL